MSYLTQLNRASQKIMKESIAQCLTGTSTVPKTSMLRPLTGDYVKVEGYYIPRGQETPFKDPKYVDTETVKNNLAEVARAVSAGRIPVLLQGETSIGKTSMIMYMAKLTGNKCVRINNHEHTDLQVHFRTKYRCGDFVTVTRKGS